MKVETEYITLELVNDIIEGEYKEIFINLETAKILLDTRYQFTIDKSLPMVVEMSRLKGIDKAARDFFNEPSGSEGLNALAIIVKSRLESFLANFIIKVNLQKSLVPIKLFTNKQAALEWLEQYK